MSLDCREWLNADFICTCLQDGERDKSIKVITLDVTTVVPPGNNYGSYLRRVLVKYKESDSEDIHHRSFIIKVYGKTKETQENFSHFADMEPLLYQRFLPETYSISSTIDFAPKSFLSPISNVIVLEDLKASGYLMADRKELLDYDHCLLYVVAAATFHAASVAVHKKNPKLVEMLGVEKMFSNDVKCGKLIKRLFLVGVKFMADKIESIDEFKKYSDILRSSCGVIWDLIVEAHKQNETFNTLTQGDPWTTNMMFKYDLSGKVTQIKLLDFQDLRYASPVSDLLFFLWSSARHDVRGSMLERICHAYCNTLNEKLEEFDCPERLSYEQLLEHMVVLSPLILFTAVTWFPFIVNEKPMDFVVMMSENCEESTIRDMIEFCYDKCYCEHHLPSILKQFESVGVFEYLKTNCGQAT